ncbi:MAG: 1-deoxy-D-xylulose-5-phosphate synthase [Longimicrobiaceae bacterium]
MKRIMYVENKGEGLEGPGRIGWVELTRARRGYRYGGRLLQKVTWGLKHNCVDAETGEPFWVSGPKQDGHDRLYGGIVEIDEDARVEYWLKIRRLPQCVDQRSYRS